MCDKRPILALTKSKQGLCHRGIHTVFLVDARKTAKCVKNPDTNAGNSKSLTYLTVEVTP